METARALVLQARELRDKGNHAAALEKYKAAHALAHTPITGIELAHTYAKLSMPVEARDVCLQVQRSPITVGESERSAAARVEAVSFAEEMLKQAASVRIVVRLPAPNLRPTVSIDAHEIPFEALGQPQRVNPGKHEVVARVGEGTPTTRQIQIAAGATQEVELEVAAPPVRRSQDPNLPPGSNGPSETRMSPLAPTGLAIAGVGTLFGILGGVIALDTQSSLQDACKVNKTCPADRNVDIDATATRAKVWATVSTVGIGVGIVGAVVAAYGFLNPIHVTSPAGTQGYRVRIQPTLGGLQLDGRF